LFSHSDKIYIAGHCSVTLPKMQTPLALVQACYLPVY